MPEVTEEAPRRLTWKLWQALLLPVPGLVFAVAWSVTYHRRLDSFVERPFLPLEGQWNLHTLGAALSSFASNGLIGIVSYIIVACSLSHTRRSKPGDTGTGSGRFGGVLITVNLAVCFAGCSLGYNAARGLRPSFLDLSPVASSTSKIWRASVSNGDKPGIGIEIQDPGHDYACTVFLLDPKFEHDFSKRAKCPTTVNKQEKDMLEIIVQWSPDMTERLRLSLPEGIQEETFRAMLSNVDSTVPGTTCEFRRLP